MWLQLPTSRRFIVHPGVGKNWLLVKVETDAGIHGWGESYTQADRDTAIEAHIHAMKRYVIGRDPVRHQALHHGDVPRLGRQARRDGLLLRPLRHRAGAVGHRGQGGGSAGLQPARRRAAERAHPRLRERLGRAAAGRKHIARGWRGRWSRGASPP